MIGAGILSILALLLIVSSALSGILGPDPDRTELTSTSEPAGLAPVSTASPTDALGGGELESGTTIVPSETSDEVLAGTSTPTASPTTTLTASPTLTATFTSTATRIPSLTPSNTPTLAPPADPSELIIADRVCAGETYTVTLKWVDNADNEEGYNIYRDGGLIAKLPSDETSFEDSPPGSGPYTYGVEAFNDAGSSKRPTVNEEGCLF